jgi:hypothetical protein
MVERCENRLAPDLKTLTNEGKVSRCSGIHQAKRTRYEILCLTAVGYARFYSRSHSSVIRVYDEMGNVIGTHEHTGEFQDVVSVTRATKSRHAVKCDG